MSDASPVRAGESLLMGNGAQLQLLEVDAAGLPAAAYAENEQRGRFTGERLFFANPSLYNAIVKLLARGIPYREIADIGNVSVNTVCGVAHRERIPIETVRERIGRLGLDVARLTVEAVLDLLADPIWCAKQSGKDLMVMHGIAFNNAQLALGGATARIETQDVVPPGHEEYLALIAAKPAERNVTPSTGLAAGNRGAKGIDAGAPGGPALDVSTGEEESAPDASESPDS